MVSMVTMIAISMRFLSVTAKGGVTSQSGGALHLRPLNQRCGPCFARVKRATLGKMEKDRPSAALPPACLVVPYLTMMKEDAPQREHPMREPFNGLRYVIRYGIAWRAMPNDLPHWHADHQQADRWLAAGCFEALAQDLRAHVASGGGTRRSARSRAPAGGRAG